jgi:hypothetical protein
VSISDGVPGAGAGNLETTASEDVYRFSTGSVGALQLDFSQCTMMHTWAYWKLVNAEPERHHRHLQAGAEADCSAMVKSPTRFVDTGKACAGRRKLKSLCGSNRSRRRAADRHPTSARPHQSRHHLDLPPRNRQHRDHRHRPRPPCADGPRRLLARALTPRPAAGRLATSSPPALVELGGHEPGGERAADCSIHREAAMRAASAACADRAKEHSRCESRGYSRQA